MKHIESKNALTYEQLLTAETCFPEHDWQAMWLIKNYLAYFPEKEKCIPYLPYIHTLIENHKKGKIDYDTYYKELEISIRMIRNNDLGNKWWVTKYPFDEYDYDCYNKELIHNRQRARDKLSALLTYEPDLNYSLHSEMLLRRVYQADHAEDSLEQNNVCFFAMASTLYRESFLKEGKEAADQSPLLGLKLYREVGLCPITGKSL